MCHSCGALQSLRVNLCMVFVRSPISISFVRVGLGFRLERLGYKSGVIVRWPWRRAAARIGHVCAAACRPKLIALPLECDSPCFLQRVPRPQGKAFGCFSRLRCCLHAGLEFSRRLWRGRRGREVQARATASGLHLASAVHTKTNAQGLRRQR